MKRVAWLSDIHLNFIRESDETFVDELRSANVDLLLIGGDIGEAGSFIGYLTFLEAALGLPIYFVLGNHDYYGSSVQRVRAAAVNATGTNSNLHWLPHVGPVALSERTALIGHGGWGDGRLGGFLASKIRLNDYYLIENLRSEDNDEWLMQKLHALGDEAADSLKDQLSRVPASASEVVVLMHVPPFREACVYEGQISDDQWLPHFTCHAAGEALQTAASERPDCKFKVLCGHTHGRGECEIAPNLTVYTAGAEYGSPKIEQVLEV